MILSRPRLLPQERFDLEDLNALLSAGRTDAKLYTKEIIANLNYVVHGFAVSGIGLKQATVNMADATLFMPANTFDFSWFTTEPGAPNVIIPEASFTAGVRNYVEIGLIEENNTLLTRAFWDPQANSGAGAEFNQIVDTITDLAATFTVLTGGFSGSPNALPLAIIDVDGSGNIKTIFDQRDLFNRLARTSNLQFSYAWGTREEPVYNLELTGVTGSFASGDSITIGTETATVVTGGTTSITFNEPSGINFFPGDAVTGATGSGTIDTVLESFTGVDKSILNEKQKFDALASEIKLVKGTKYWWQNPSSSAVGLSQAIDSFLVQAVHGASWAWDGSNLSITDDNLLPLSGDILGYVRLFGSAQQLGMQRQDGQGGSVVIPIPDQSILFVKYPPTGDRNFSGVGSGDTHYQVVDIASYVPADGTYWLAYRDLNSIYVRDYGELDPGESTPISDPDKEAILALINANQNKSDQDRNLKLIEGGVWSNGVGTPIVLAQFTTGTDETTASVASSTWIGQEYKPTSSNSLDNFIFYLRNAGSTPTGTMVVKIYDDNSGVPGTLLATSNPVNVSVITGSYTPITFTLPSPLAQTSGVQYYAIIDFTNTVFTGGVQINFQGSLSGGYADGANTLTIDSGASWIISGSKDCNFIANGIVPGSSVSWSSDAFIQIPGLVNARNRIPAGSFSLVNANDVAYVEINRAAGAPASLSVLVTDDPSVVLDDNLVIIGRLQVDGSVIVGTHTFLLAPNESKELEAGLSIENRTYTGIVSEADSDPDYVSSPSGSLALPNFNGTNGEDLTVRLAKVTSMLADARQDLNLEFDPGIITWDGTNITVTSAQLSIPGTTIGAAAVSINTLGLTALPSNSCLYVDISRSVGTALTLAVSTLALLTPAQQRLVLVRNIGGNLLVR